MPCAWVGGVQLLPQQMKQLLRCLAGNWVVPLPEPLNGAHAPIMNCAVPCVVGATLQQSAFGQTTWPRQKHHTEMVHGNAPLTQGTDIPFLALERGRPAVTVNLAEDTKQDMSRQPMLAKWSGKALVTVSLEPQKWISPTHFEVTPCTCH